LLVVSDKLAKVAIGRPSGAVSRNEIKVIEDAAAAHSLLCGSQSEPGLTDKGGGINLVRASAIDPPVKHVPR
jgi:hypothetical protein